MADNVVWQPQPGPQSALLACPVFEVFFGGARGGGKTDAMLGDFIVHADQYGENAIGLMVRRQRTELIETMERSRQLYLPLGAKFNEQEKYWRFPNGARLRFAYLERDADADAYQGHSYSRLYVEEIGSFPSRAPIAKLMATLRSGAGVPVGFRATGNPGGPGHQHVKARYIDPCPSGWRVMTEEFVDPWSGAKVTRDRVFIPSKLADNKYLGAEYVANLQMVGSAELVRAWLEGDWDIVEGAFFDGWSHRKHVLRPFAVPREWLRFRAMDWGYASPASIGWWAVVQDDFEHPADGRLLPRGALVRYREWYVASAPGVGARFDAERVAAGILSREGDDEAIAYGVLDPAAFSEDGGPSIAERMARAGVRFKPADNRRIAKKGAIGGWDAMRARLRGHGDTPMLYVFETCQDFIRTVPVLQHDRDRPEDLDTDAEDHVADECFVAGTMIETETGPRAIETLRVGDLVQTRTGFHPVEAVFSVGERPVFDLTLSDGSVLTGTGNHPVFADNQWVSLANLRYGSMLSPCAKPSYSKAFDTPGFLNTRIGIAGSITGRIARLCIALSGKVFTGRSAIRNCSSIMSTETRSTTTSPILNLLKMVNTRDGIGRNASRSFFAASIAETISRAVRGGMRSIAEMLAGLPHAANRAWMTCFASAAPAIASTAQIGTPNAGIVRWNALRAASTSAPIMPMSAPSAESMRLPRTGAPGSALPHVVSVTPVDRRKVFNLTVAEAEEYYANGVLVHNCRYACMSRPWMPKTAKAPKERKTGITMNELWEQRLEPLSRIRV